MFGYNLWQQNKQKPRTNKVAGFSLSTKLKQFTETNQLH